MKGAVMLEDRKKTWLLVADSARLKIYEWSDENRHIHEVINRVNEDARTPDRSLKVDRPGHGHREGVDSRYAIDEKVNYKKQASELFLKAAAIHISEDGIMSKFDKLVIIAQHDIYKTLISHFSSQAKDKVILHHPKDLANMPMQDVENYYSEKLK